MKRLYSGCIDTTFIQPKPLKRVKVVRLYSGCISYTTEKIKKRFIIN